VIVSWDPDIGFLQSADAVTGPWTDVEDPNNPGQPAPNPVTLPNPVRTKKFYSIRRP